MPLNAVTAEGNGSLLDRASAMEFKERRRVESTAVCKCGACISALYGTGWRTKEGEMEGGREAWPLKPSPMFNCGRFRLFARSSMPGLPW